jgi:hypothetical protein
VPSVIDYSVVSSTLLGARFESLYHNSGAFGFPRAVSARHVGWIGPQDPTLKESARPLTRRVPEPYAQTLAALAVRAWREHLPGPVWLMPRNHWAFELDHGNSEWMPGLLREVGINPALLSGRNDGSAIEFATGESAALEPALAKLMTDLWGSDFALAWPGRPVLCTVHHHTQLWWTTTDDAFVAALDALVPPTQWWDGTRTADS